MVKFYKNIKSESDLVSLQEEYNTLLQEARDYLGNLQAAHDDGSLESNCFNDYYGNGWRKPVDKFLEDNNLKEENGKVSFITAEQSKEDEYKAEPRGPR